MCYQYKEAVSSIEDACAFLQSKGHATETNQMMEIFQQNHTASLSTNT